MNSVYSEDQILYQEGRSAMEKNDFAAALASLKKSANIFPHFKTYESVGVCLLKLGNFSEAVLYLSASAGLGNNQSKPLFLLAQALIELRTTDWARDKLNQALAINPDYKAAKELLSVISNKY